MPRAAAFRWPGDVAAAEVERLKRKLKHAEALVSAAEKRLEEAEMKRDVLAAELKHRTVESGTTEQA